MGGLLPFKSGCWDMTVLNLNEKALARRAFFVVVDTGIE